MEKKLWGKGWGEVTVEKGMQEVGPWDRYVGRGLRGKGCGEGD